MIAEGLLARTDPGPGLTHVESLRLGPARILHNRASGALVASDAFGAALIDGLRQTGEFGAAIRATAAALDIAEDALAGPAAETFARWQADGLFLAARQPFPGAVAYRPADAAREIGFRLDGCAVRLRSECDDLAGDIARALAPMRLDQGAGDGAVVLDVMIEAQGLAVFRDGAPVWGVSGYELARFHCLREIMDALAGPRRVAAHLHASAVEKDGAGLVFAGASGSGKSTLATLLLGAGARLAADDHVAIGTDGATLRAFPTRSNLKPGAEALAEVRAAVAAPVARMPAGAPVRLAGFVFPEYHGPGAANALTPMPGSEALQRLIQTGSRVSRTTRSVAPLVRALATGPCYRLGYGDSGFAVARCLELLAGATVPARADALADGPAS